MTNENKTIPKRVKKSKTTICDECSDAKNFWLYLLIFNENNINIANIPILYQMGITWTKYPSTKVNIKAKKVDFIKLFNFSPIIKFKRLIAIPKVIIISKLKFFNSTPCKVTKIFQIETKENKNIEDINA